MEEYCGDSPPPQHGNNNNVESLYELAETADSGAVGGGADFAFGKPSALLASVLDEVDIAAEYDSDSSNDQAPDGSPPSRMHRSVMFSRGGESIRNRKRTKKSNANGNSEEGMLSAADHSENSRRDKIQDEGEEEGEDDDEETEFFADDAVAIPQLEKWLMITEDAPSEAGGSESVSRSETRARSLAENNMFFLFGADSRSASRMRTSVGNAAPSPSAAAAAAAGSASSQPQSQSRHERPELRGAAGRFRGVQQRKDDMLDLLARMAESSPLSSDEEKHRSPNAAARRKQQVKKASLEALKEFYGL